MRCGLPSNICDTPCHDSCFLYTNRSDCYYCCGWAPAPASSRAGRKRGGSLSSTRPRPRTTTAHRRRRTATNGIPSPQLLPTLLVPSRPSAPAVSASHLCPHLSPRACPQVRRWTGSLRTYLRIACSIPSVSPSCSCPNASACHSALHVPVCALPERHLHS